jgi:hypothetical protein
MLKFYKNYLRRKQAEVLFVQIEGDFKELPAVCEDLIKYKDKYGLTIVLTDLKEGSEIFSLLEDTPSLHELM